MTILSVLVIIAFPLRFFALRTWQPLRNWKVMAQEGGNACGGLALHYKPQSTRDLLNLRKRWQPLMFLMVGQLCLHLRMGLVASVRRGSPVWSLGCLGMWVVCVIESFWWNVLVPWLGDGDCSQCKPVVQFFFVRT